MRTRVRPRALLTACAVLLAVAACTFGATKVLATVNSHSASSLKLAAQPTTAKVPAGAAAKQHKKIRYLRHHAAPKASPVHPTPTMSPTSTPTVNPTVTTAAPVGTPSTSTPPVQTPPTATPAPASAPPAPPAGSNPNCSGAANTPGGADPWGGCWPGPGNTGPTGALTPYTGEVRSDGSCIITSDTVITGQTMECTIVINSGNVTLDNVSLNGQVYNNGSGTLTIENSVINGGDAMTETVLGNNLIIKDSNLYGNQHEVYCGGNCTVEDSYLHDNHNFGSSDHQNGFLSTGGSVYNLQHNTVGCVGGCTGDITFLGDESNATVNQNLLLAAPSAAYCLYPASAGATHPIVNQMTITNNVIQRGANGKCATYGPVYGWDTPNNSPGTSGYHNVWSGNLWDNGKAINE